jgi:hypothetical protein
MKTCRRLAKYACFWLLLAEGRVTRQVFGAILQRLEVLQGHAG